MFEYRPVSKPQHGRRKKKRGQHTEVTQAVRNEIDRRSREIWNVNIRCCERCGTIHNLTAAHIVNASQYGSGSDPANLIQLCGTHGFGGCHDWADNTAAGRKWKKEYAEFLQNYYKERGRET